MNQQTHDEADVPPWERPPSQLEQEFLAAIGNIIIQFGRIERVVDIALMNGGFVAPKGYYSKREEVPLPFKTKLAALRAVCANTPAIGQRKWVEAFIVEATDLAEIRNFIAHGYTTEITKEAEPRIRFNRGRFSPRSMARETFEPTLSELAGYAWRLTKLEREYGILMLAINSMIGKERRKAGVSTRNQMAQD